MKNLKLALFFVGFNLLGTTSFGASPYPSQAPDLISSQSDIHYLSDRLEVNFTAEVMLKGSLRKHSGLAKNQSKSVTASGKWGNYASGPYLLKDPKNSQWRILFLKKSGAASKNGPDTCYFLFRREEAFAPKEDGSRIIIGKDMEATVIDPINCEEIDRVNILAKIPGYEEFQPLSESGKKLLSSLNGSWEIHRNFQFTPFDSVAGYLGNVVQLSYADKLNLTIDPQVGSLTASSESRFSSASGTMSKNTTSQIKGNIVSSLFRESRNASGELQVLFWSDPMIPANFTVGQSTGKIRFTYAPIEVVKAKTSAEFLPLDDKGRCDTKNTACNVFKILENSISEIEGDIVIFSQPSGLGQFQIKNHNFKTKQKEGELLIDRD